MTTTPDVVTTPTCHAPQHIVSCWAANSAPCQVVSQFADHLAADVDTSELRRLLPCEYCPVALAHWCDHLPRLGKVRRRVLLDAVPDAFKVLTPADDTRAESEALRRAIRDLWGAGLVWISHEAVDRKLTGRLRWSDWEGVYYHDTYTRRYNRRSVQLCPLGAALVRHARQALESGARIRWDDHRAALVEECAESPAALVARLRQELTEQKQRWHTIASIDAQLGSRDAARKALEAAQHLGAIITAIDCP